MLFGATGFTGGLTAEYLAREAPDGLRWALAGRNAAKLAAVRHRLVGHRPRLGRPRAARRRRDRRGVAGRGGPPGRVVITTVGPYLTYGEPLVAACAEAGTDYVDLTGEPEFVDRMWLAHHATAERTGARLVHACGFDSIPHDLGASSPSSSCPTTGRSRCAASSARSGTFSGGTFHSAINAMSRGRGRCRTASAGAPPRRATARGPVLARGRRQAAPRPGARLLAAARCRRSTRSSWPAAAPRWRRTARSSATPTTPAPRRCGTPPAAPPAVAALGLAAQVAAAAQPAARAGSSRARGPTRRGARSRGSPSTSSARAAVSTVHTRVSGGDPGYAETAKMLAESALCLAFDDNPETAGQVTTAVAMGENLLDRLQRAGIGFEVVH